MKVGEVFRYARPYSAVPDTFGSFPNFFAGTRSPGAKKVTLDAGITPIASVRTTDGPRQPAILISSSPHKRGQAETPWHDTFDPDNGVVTYYGDNKSWMTQPTAPRGNATLLRQFPIHTSPDPEVRKQAVPILLWERVEVDGKAKGFVAFRGFGIITKCELVTQFHPRTHEYFSNYRWEFAVFSLKHENESFPWHWISARRNPSCTTAESAKLAPISWRDWLESGPRVLENVRRDVLRMPITPVEVQRLAKGDRNRRLLEEVYERYESSKHSFENLASFVCARYLRREHVRYTEGWITPRGGDGGIDFIGRIDVGSGFGRCRLAVLGQAKCESLDQPTNGVHIARTVARLRRGWLGAYVTTSYFSPRVQREVSEDEFPLVMIGGKRMAEQLALIIPEEGFASLTKLLDFVDGTYATMLRRATADAILRDEFTPFR